LFAIAKLLFLPRLAVGTDKPLFTFPAERLSLSPAQVGMRSSSGGDMGKAIVILGIFVADTAYRAKRMPVIGETILGQDFKLGLGGKGSNQAIAAARAGGNVRFISRLGDDTFGAMARAMWEEAGIMPDVVMDKDNPTGAAFIFLEAQSGNNAIIVAPGAAGLLSHSDIDARADSIAKAGVFLTQLETPIGIVRHALTIARDGGARTILNPAPAAPIESAMMSMCDFITPNESEAEALTGIPVTDLDSARRAAAILLERGAGAALITLGAQGVLFHDSAQSVHVPALSLGPVIETTGAGDAFNGAFATALCEGRDPVMAARFGCVAASISVTRPGAGSSNAHRTEIEAILAAQG